MPPVQLGAAAQRRNLRRPLWEQFAVGIEQQHLGSFPLVVGVVLRQITCVAPYLEMAPSLHAATVVVLDALRGSYPLLHPGWVFMRLLADTVEGLIEDDRRLFYVACTRAVKRLILLTDGEHSPFMEPLERLLGVLDWSDFPPPNDDDARGPMATMGSQGGAQGRFIPVPWRARPSLGAEDPSRCGRTRAARARPHAPTSGVGRIRPRGPSVLVNGDGPRRLLGGWWRVDTGIPRGWISPCTSVALTKCGLSGYPLPRSVQNSCSRSSSSMSSPRRQ